MELSCINQTWLCHVSHRKELVMYHMEVTGRVLFLWIFNFNDFEKINVVWKKALRVRFMECSNGYSL